MQLARHIVLTAFDMFWHQLSAKFAEKDLWSVVKWSRLAQNMTKSKMFKSYKGSQRPRLKCVQIIIKSISPSQTVISHTFAIWSSSFWHDQLFMIGKFNLQQLVSNINDFGWMCLCYVTYKTVNNEIHSWLIFINLVSFLLERHLGQLCGYFICMLCSPSQNVIHI